MTAFGVKDDASSARDEVVLGPRIASARIFAFHISSYVKNTEELHLMRTPRYALQCTDHLFQYVRRFRPTLAFGEYRKFRNYPSETAGNTKRELAVAATIRHSLYSNQRSELLRYRFRMADMTFAQGWPVAAAVRFAAGEVWRRGLIAAATVTLRVVMTSSGAKTFDAGRARYDRSDYFCLPSLIGLRRSAWRPVCVSRFRFQGVAL